MILKKILALNLAADFLSRVQLRSGDWILSPGSGSGLESFRQGRGAPLCIAGLDSVPPLVLTVRATGDRHFHSPLTLSFYFISFIFNASIKDQRLHIHCRV